MCNETYFRSNSNKMNNGFASKSINLLTLLCKLEKKNLFDEFNAHSIDSINLILWLFLTNWKKKPILNLTSESHSEIFACFLYVPFITSITKFVFIMFWSGKNNCRNTNRIENERQSKSECEREIGEQQKTKIIHTHTHESSFEFLF